MPLLIGDPAPAAFHARCNVNPNFRFDTMAGRYIVLTFAADPAGDVEAAVIDRLAAAADIFNDDFASLFLVVPVDGEQGVALPLRVPGVRAFFDHDGAIAKRFMLKALPGLPVSFVLTPRLQVVGIFVAGDEPARHGDRVLEFMRRLAPPRQMGVNAPVLILPYVFEPELCHRLIDGYKANGGEISGFMRDVGGKTVGLHDTSHKMRRDWAIEDQQLIDLTQNRIKRRIVPELRKVFQFEATRIERHIVACYDAAEGGYFRPHRDNTTKGTAHRRFAVTLNLNAEEYEGGGLRFPEYGPQTYKAPTGGCVVFSCSMLHEATPVTKGTRYAFLPFLYDEAAREIRDENLPFLAERS